MPENNQIERIEQYHMGSMSTEDAAMFEKELASDPALKAESDFQSTIINGIKEHRKMALKSRLDAIDVSPGWVEFVQQSALVKSFGGIAIATIIGSGVYFLADEKREEKPADEFVSEVEMTGPQLQKFSYEWTLPEAGSTSAMVPSKIEVVENTVEENKKESVVNTPDSPETEAVAESFTPNFTAPQAGDVTDEIELKSSGLDEVLPGTETAEVNEEPIEVETKNSRSSKIRYKYYDGKLFLNGNFNNEPYEILEINSSKGRRIYLLHQRKYYEVKITDRLTELPEVTNIKLIQELRLIKENK